MSIYLLSDSFHEGVINLPQIKVIYKNLNLDLEPYDVLIFSSKNSVKAIENINKDWQKIPSYTIGKPTAKMVKKLGGKVAFIATSSYGDAFAQELSTKLKGKKVLFLRAKKVLSNLESILKNNQINITSEIVYETICNDTISLHVKSEKNVFIFTSPSTVDCFFAHYEWKKNYIAVCIGTVTAQAIPDKIPLYVSKVQTILGCIDLAKRVIKQN